MSHIPVLLKEVMEYLNPKPGDVILDGTLNGGGHSEEILKAIGKNGKLIGIEQDMEVLEKLKSRIRGDELWKKATLINGNFRNLDELLALCKIEKLDGVLFDFGLSSLQLDDSDRGFSFQRNAPLLMTFKSGPGPNDLTAADIVNDWGEKDIANVLYGYGEERYSRRIARAITETREKKRIETTFDLAEIVRKSVPVAYRRRRIDCCTRTFQALRIAVNDELNAIEEGIKKAWEMLSEDSRIVTISFHSLEDRIVKNFFKEEAKNGRGKILTKKPLVPSDEEIFFNPRSRSAKLRAMEKSVQAGEGQREIL